MKHYRDMSLQRPDYDTVAASYDDLFSEFASEPLTAVQKWDVLRRTLSDYRSLSQLHVAQDTHDEGARAERDFGDEFFPRVRDLVTRMKRQLLARRDELSADLGEHIFDLWTADVATFEPTIQQLLVDESRTKNERSELLARAEVMFDGETRNLPQLAKYWQSGDRAVREASVRAYWGWYADHGDALDDIYDRLVAQRTQIAKELGYDNYTPLGYLRMRRIDYDAADVAAFRREVVEHIVPLAQQLKAEQARRIGVDELMVWDDAVQDPDGTPSPQGSPDELVQQATRMFDSMHPELGSFFRMMQERGLMDLIARKGKSGGGFCTSLEGGAPFVFANFNGTATDIDVFTHEMGHAFQCWLSRDNYPMDLVWPTLESCEIHSMSLEFLCAPHMELFFGDGADRYRRLHLVDNLTFIPYGVAVDHFQHLVYDNPDATAQDRHDMWLQMEDTYLPWRKWGDIEHGRKGAGWHKQSHIFSSPFYYIDYVLALTCALQFWARMQDDSQTALDDYVALCRRGGSAPFLQLARSASLRSPFEAGCLTSVVDRARAALGM